MLARWFPWIPSSREDQTCAWWWARCDPQLRRLCCWRLVSDGCSFALVTRWHPAAQAAAPRWLKGSSAALEPVVLVSKPSAAKVQTASSSMPLARVLIKDPDNSPGCISRKPGRGIQWLFPEHSAIHGKTPWGFSLLFTGSFLSNGTRMKNPPSLTSIAALHTCLTLSPMMASSHIQNTLTKVTDRVLFWSLFTAFTGETLGNIEFTTTFCSKKHTHVHAVHDELALNVLHGCRIFTTTCLNSASIFFP